MLLSEAEVEIFTIIETLSALHMRASYVRIVVMSSKSEAEIISALRSLYSRQSILIREDDSFVPIGD